MASTASGFGRPPASTSAPEIIAGTSLEQAERPQAGPLPVKSSRLVGEIGYSEEVGQQETGLGDSPDDDMDSMEGLNAAEVDARNGRHPADRSHVDLPSQTTTSSPDPNSVSTRQASHNLNESTSSLNTTSKHSIFSLHSLSRLSVKTYGGVSLKTIIRLCVLIATLGGLIAAWVFAAKHFSHPPAGSSNSPQALGTSAIFIHVAFAVTVLLLVIFIERAIFQFRAERYAHVHPGQVLPSHRHGAELHSASNGMAFAPWNRPPLPTYAAALGVRGTGDVEDAIIAAPPPPAYGNTRGSTLILAAMLRSSRSSARSRASRDPEAPWLMVNRPGADGRMSSVTTRSLPISYEEAEHHSDVERARILEEALAKLEDNTGRRRLL